MLRELSIKNFAIIEEQTVSFGDGLNVISGETGAGKSVILQALEIILGGRPKSKYIREGTEGWEIQALFELSGLPIELREELPDIAQGDELIVSRTMHSSGRGKVYINGRLGTVQLLQEVCSILVQICAQGGQSKLLDPDYHLQIVDDYSGAQEELRSYQKIWSDYRTKKKELDEYHEKKAARLLRLAELQYLTEELSQFELQDDIRLQLETEIRRESSVQEVVDAGNVVSNLFGNDRGVLALLQEGLSRITDIAKLRKEFEPYIEQAQELFERCNDLDGALTGALAGCEVNEPRLEEAREQLSELARLERKYKTNASGLSALLSEAQRELGMFHDESYIKELDAEVVRLQGELDAAVKTLSKKRGQATKKLIKEVQSELADLNMSGSALHIEHHTSDYTPTGADHIELMLSSQGGKKRFSLREIASGGELSRILLILKKVLRDKSGVNVLVFDEVDTGISGKVARAVGEKLKSIATDSQVICITHLAQVASLADQHFIVSKDGQGNSISQLSKDERIEEIARMLAGYQVTDASRESARELLSSI